MRRAPMTQYLFRLFFAISFFIFFACQDDDEVTDPKTSADECLTTRSSHHGQIIPGEYIVSFENDSQNSGRSARTAARVLSDHRVSSEKITDEIDGESLHYVVRLSAEEAEKLKDDPQVQALEPDRIMSLCACFTVLEPRSVAWN